MTQNSLVKKNYDTLGPRRPLSVFSRFMDDFFDLDSSCDFLSLKNELF